MPPASPAVQPIRTAGLVDFRKHAEYPIVLGDSLKDDATSADKYIDIRFNWQPKAGFKNTDSRLRRTEDGYRLNVNDNASDELAYKYLGHDRQLSRDGDEVQSFALVFDKKRSVFVLESIAQSIDLNLDAAALQSKDDVRRRPQLPKVSHGSKKNQDNSEDDDEPDPENPFDFRNFLDEAKETTEKAAGFKSPLPGSRTPMSGFASPALGAHRFTPTVTQAVSREAKPLQPRPKTQSETPKRKLKPVTDRKPATARPQSHQPLSNERISDSDDELSDAPVIKVSQPSSKAQARAASPTKSQTRKASLNIDDSPHIVVNDGDLEIDMGSPPQAAKARKRRIDAEAFRSHTGTPVIGQSPRMSVPPRQDVEMKDVHKDNDSDEDDDVDELELGSPRRSTHLDPSRGTTSTSKKPKPQPAPSEPEPESNIAPTPPNQNAMSEDDEVAELEDLLGGDGDDDADTSAGLGLGISGGVAQDDDSEVSEEE